MAFRKAFHRVRFVDLMVVQAEHVVSSAQLLAEVLAGDPASREKAAAGLQTRDQEAERAARAVLSTLSGAFVTPFDRADLFRVSWSLRRCVAAMDAIADEIVLFRIEEVPVGVSELVGLAVRSADVTREGVRLLARPAEITDLWIELVRLSKQAGREHRRLIAELTTTETDPVLLIRMSCLAWGLRGLASAFDEVADALQTVAVKEA